MWLKRLWAWFLTTPQVIGVMLLWSRLTDTGHVNVSKLNDLLWVGGAITTEAEVAELVGEGIGAVVDCRLESDDRSLVDGYNEHEVGPTHPALKRLDHYLYVGVADDGQPKPVEWFKATWDFSKPLLDQGVAIYDHCSAGVNRGPSIAYFTLRAYWKLSGDDAMALLKVKRPQVNVAYRPDADRALQALGLNS